MATQEKTWNVANRLHSQKDSDNPEVNHIIAGADEIYDDAKGAKQSDINAQNDAALADRYTKSETYSKEQVDSLITTPDVNYVTVATFADLPQTGEADTIYRVSSYDGTQVDASKYALYAWNGATYQLLAVRSAVGEVFDVSEYNTGATYETLSAALAAVPASVQKGGMSIKFVQSSDKYVQFRLMKNTWSSTESDWQGVDDEPTAGSENLVKSGGVYDSMTIYTGIDLSLYPQRQASLGTASFGWYVGNGSAHKAVPVEPGQQYYLEDNSFFGWLTSSYNPNKTYTNRSAIPYVSGTDRITYGGLITVPSGAAYLCLVVVDGSGAPSNPTLRLVHSIKDIVQNVDAEPVENSINLVASGGVFNSVEKKFDKAKINQTYELSNCTERNCSLGEDSWYDNKSVCHHKYVPVIPGHSYIIEGTSLYENKYLTHAAFLTDQYNTETEYSKGNSIPFASGSRISVIIGDVLTATPNAAYLAVNTVGGEGVRFPLERVVDLELASSKIGYIGNFYEEDYNPVNLDSYTPAAGILNGTTGWYTATGYSHIAVPVTPGERYIIKSSHWFCYGLLSSYSGTGTNPAYASGRARRQLCVAGVYEVIIPQDCTYIVFTRTSDGTYVLPDVMWRPKMLPYILGHLGKENVKQKIRFAHWNVGHFSYYDMNTGSKDTSITAENSEAMAMRYKTIINKVSPDIFGICEFNPEFDLGGGLAKDLILQNYAYNYIGQKRGYPCNSIFSNIKGVFSDEVLYTTHQQNTYYKYANMNIGGVEVCVVETHLDWYSVEINTAQMQQLISAFTDKPYVIIGGDFNVAGASQYQLLQNAGYTVANCGYLGMLDTYLRYQAEESELFPGLDNIAVKGFAMSNIKAWDESGWIQGGLSDHSILSCDLIML